MNVKLCECGCGQPAPISLITRNSRGYKRGEPQRFIDGHFRHPKKTISEAFYAVFVAGAPGECWEWQGQGQSMGYGRVSCNGGRFLAHRVSYELHCGPILDGLHVCHRCDNPICVNPDHLFLGDHADNVADMVNKGRNQHGDTNGTRKLDSTEVRQIRRLYAEGVLQRELAEMFGVAPNTISSIVNRVTWKHLED